MKNSTRSLIIIAIALVVFSVVAFAIPFAHTTAFWVAYGFGALAMTIRRAAHRRPYNNHWSLF